MRFNVVLVVLLPVASAFVATWSSKRTECAVVVEANSPFWFAEEKKTTDDAASKGLGFFGGDAEAAKEPPSLAKLRSEVREATSKIDESMANTAKVLRSLEAEMAAAKAATVKAVQRAELASVATLEARAEKAEYKREKLTMAQRSLRDKPQKLEGIVTAEKRGAEAASLKAQVLNSRTADIAEARQAASQRLEDAKQATLALRADLKAAVGSAAARVAQARSDAEASLKSCQAQRKSIEKNLEVASRTQIKPSTTVGVAFVLALVVSDALGLDELDIIIAIAAATFAVTYFDPPKPQQPQ